jgi:hypothetical protein
MIAPLSVHRKGSLTAWRIAAQRAVSAYFARQRGPDSRNR